LMSKVITSWVMARRKKETVLKKVLKHERKTSPKANIPGPPGTGTTVVLELVTLHFVIRLVASTRNRYRYASTVACARSSPTYMYLIMI
jgi:Cdc6-like AAA superfamily ATPase